MKADMTQVSVYRGQGLERKSGIGTGSKVHFFSELNITTINETNHTES